MRYEYLTGQVLLQKYITKKLKKKNRYGIPVVVTIGIDGAHYFEKYYI